jgi:hypothetical protein
MNDCYFTKKDWRQCKGEVSHAGTDAAECKHRITFLLAWVFTSLPYKEARN